MEDRFKICKVNICCFERNKISGVTPLLDEYPELRLCVVDNEKNIAIDVEHELKYDYLQTMSGLYIINATKDKIKDNKRLALFSYMFINITREEEEKALEIKRKLEEGYVFCDGNDVFSNDEYLALLNKEKQKPEKGIRAKIKMIKKSRKN